MAYLPLLCGARLQFLVGRRQLRPHQRVAVIVTLYAVTLYAVRPSRYVGCVATVTVVVSDSPSRTADLYLVAGLIGLDPVRRTSTIGAMRPERMFRCQYPETMTRRHRRAFSPEFKAEWSPCATSRART